MPLGSAGRTNASGSPMVDLEMQSTLDAAMDWLDATEAGAAVQAALWEGEVAG